VRNYTVRATVDYDDQEGNPSEPRPVAFALKPAPEREYKFSAGEFDSDLRVGEEGTLSGTVTNTGDRVAHNVVVVFETHNLKQVAVRIHVTNLTLGKCHTDTTNFWLGKTLVNICPKRFHVNLDL
jgi:hypothetical protein